MSHEATALPAMLRRPPDSRLQEQAQTLPPLLRPSRSVGTKLPSDTRLLRSREQTPLPAARQITRVRRSRQQSSPLRRSRSNSRKHACKPALLAGQQAPRRGRPQPRRRRTRPPQTDRRSSCSTPSGHPSRHASNARTSRKRKRLYRDDLAHLSGVGGQPPSATVKTNGEQQAKQLGEDSKPERRTGG